jgi:predicted transcriptional regulator
VDVKIPKTGAVTVRLDPELKARLVQAAARLDLSENDIVRHALRAAVNAIEANDYKLELPLEMALGKRPIESRVTGARL